MRAALLVPTLLLLAAGAAHAAPVCPVSHHGRPLEHVTVFDGPPADMASLRPEDHETGPRLRQTWNIADIVKLGRQPYVECRFRGGAVEVVKPPESAKTCSQELARLNHKGDYRLMSFRCD